jgi:vacuolar-type H+-ATPase subunit H
MANHPRHAASREDAAKAMEAVLEAEQAATAELDRRREEAARLVETARDEARNVVNRALDGAARRRERHARALARRVEVLRARAVAEEGAAPVDPGALERAVARLAARLTGDDAAP